MAIKLRRPRTLTHALTAFDALLVRVEVLERDVAANCKELEVQFKRIAQLQAELDELRTARMRA
jgi:cell division protein FtsB